MFSFTEIKRDLHAVGAEAADECGLGREAQSHYDLISIFEDQLAQLDEVLLSDTGAQEPPQQPPSLWCTDAMPGKAPDCKTQ